MDDSFFERPILNSPYAYPALHWELDTDGQPTNRIIETRRRCDLITPVPKPQRRRRAPGQPELDVAVKVINHLGDEVMKVFSVR
jgi:type III restriction enzyme